MSTATAQRSFLRHLENFSHHIYAAYSDKNATEVRLVLDHLRQHGLKVYDPATERIPGKVWFHTNFVDLHFKVMLSRILYSTGWRIKMKTLFSLPFQVTGIGSF